MTQNVGRILKFLSELNPELHFKAFIILFSKIFRNCLYNVNLKRKRKINLRLEFRCIEKCRCSTDSLESDNGLQAVRGCCKGFKRFHFI